MSNLEVVTSNASAWEQITDHAMSWCERVRCMNEDGTVNIEATTELIQSALDREVAVAFEPLDGAGYLISYDEAFVICIDSTLSYEQQLITYGHEIGHIFLRSYTGLQSANEAHRDETQEAFCEWFAHHLARNFGSSNSIS